MHVLAVIYMFCLQINFLPGGLLRQFHLAWENRSAVSPHVQLQIIPPVLRCVHPTVGCPDGTNRCNDFSAISLAKM